MAGAHQVCLAHVLRDVQYAIDCGDSVVAPKIRDLLRWTIGIGRRRDTLRDTTLKHYLGKADPQPILMGGYFRSRSRSGGVSSSSS